MVVPCVIKRYHHQSILCSKKESNARKCHFMDDILSILVGSEKDIKVLIWR